MLALSVEIRTQIFHQAGGNLKDKTSYAGFLSGIIVCNVKTSNSFNSSISLYRAGCYSSYYLLNPVLQNPSSKILPILSAGVPTYPNDEAAVPDFVLAILSLSE